MKTISINDIEFDVPTCYNELSASQLRKVARALTINEPKNQLIMLYSLLGLKFWNWKQRQKWKIIKELPAEWVHTLLVDNTLFGWVFDKADINYKYQYFWLKGIKYVGPPKGILKVTAAELVFSYGAFRNYSKTGDIKHIDSLLAILYRPINPMWWLNALKYGYNGDKRISLNNFMMERRKKMFAKLNAEFKMILFLQFTSEWSKWEKMEQNKYIFRKGAVDETKKEDPYIWQKIMMKMAESGIFGPLQEVEKMDKDRFFLAMSKNIEEWMELKK